MQRDLIGYEPIPGCPTGIILHDEPCKIVLPAETISAQSRVAFRIDEFPSAEVEITGCDLNVPREVTVSIKFVQSGFELSGVQLGGNPRTCRIGGYSHEHRVRYTEPISVSNGRAITAASAFIYNMGRFSFHGRPTAGLDVLKLSIEECIFEIGPIPHEYADAVPRITTPWHVPTNFLRITSLCEGGLQPGDLEAGLFLLRQFLSFVWGRYVGIALAEGYDTSGQLAFAHWGTMTFDARVPGARPGHWFAPGHAEVMQDIIPGYWRKCRDPHWRDVIEWAIYWWLSANHLGQRSETSILASQAALEGLALKILTESGWSITSFEKLKAFEKITELMKTIKGPLPVPSGLTELASFATKKRVDGPRAFVQVRDALVHPAKHGEDRVAFEASQLGMWYLELSLLFLFGFEGQYRNRTVFDAPFWLTERVPWAPELLAGG